MLTFTENAATVIKGLVRNSEEPGNAGLRIGTRSGASRLRVEIAAAPEAGDAVIENNGARIFLDAVASPQLSNKELDALIDQESIQFVLRHQ